MPDTTFEPSSDSTLSSSHSVPAAAMKSTAPLDGPDDAESGESSAATTDSGWSDAVGDLVVENPMTSMLVSAAVGAGLVALLAMMARDRSPDSTPDADAIRSRTNRAASKVSTDTGALKAQVAEFASKLLDALPTRQQAQQAVQGAGESASDAAGDVWNEVRDQAQDLLDRLRPRLGDAQDAARAHPVWAAVAVGTLGALVAALGRPSTKTSS